MIFCYDPVDVFICFSCQEILGKRSGLCYEPGQVVPHCCGSKMGLIGTMPRSTYNFRKELASRKWAEFLTRHQRELEATKTAYDLGVA